ncbi:MAG: hemerythrin domain-containing protein [Acidimicrobiaceae bacterium]|nr:hemerythrin domain-containing protein [Acidimicrobiaceae bacterium]
MEAQDFLARRHDELREQFERVSDPDSDRVQALGRLTQLVAGHISAEQSLVVPLLKRKAIGDRRLVRRLKSEYRRMGRLALRIERRKANSPDLPALVTDLQDAYERHVRRFELYVDPKLRGRVDADELEDVQKAMDSAESTIMSHPHAHLISLGPLSRFTTRMAAVVGRQHGESPPPGGLWRRRN